MVVFEVRWGGRNRRLTSLERGDGPFATFSARLVGQLRFSASPLSSFSTG